LLVDSVESTMMRGFANFKLVTLPFL